MFTDRWRWDNMQGNLHAWFSDGYVGMRVPYFRLETGGTRLSGSFSLARPVERTGQRVAMLVDGDVLGVEQARTYVPYRLSDGLRQWLHEGPRSGRIVGPRLAYQGQVHTLPDDRSRRLEIQARLSDGEVRYHPDWPVVYGGRGIHRDRRLRDRSHRWIPRARSRPRYATARCGSATAAPLRKWR